MGESYNFNNYSLLLTEKFYVINIGHCGSTSLTTVKLSTCQPAWQALTTVIKIYTGTESLFLIYAKRRSD
jgi:hypothetical protein